MSKFMARAAGRLAGFVLLFTLSILSVPLVAGPGFLNTAQAAEKPYLAESVRSSAPPAAQPASETQALVVGSVALALILGLAGAVMWYTSRHRNTIG